jgi:hypothetical protein
MPAPACAPGGTAESRRGKSRTTSRTGASNPKQFHIDYFKLSFLAIFKQKCPKL